MSEKKFGKRLLTWVLVIVMMLTMVPMNVLADEKGTASTANLSPDDLYYKFDGTKTDKDLARITLSKKAKDNGNGTYTVTLSAKADEVVTPKPTQVVFLLDASGSMNFCTESNVEVHNHSRGGPGQFGCGYYGPNKEEHLQNCDAYKSGRHIHTWDENSIAFCTNVKSNGVQSRWDQATAALNTMSDKLKSSNIDIKYAYFQTVKGTGDSWPSKSEVVSSYDNITPGGGTPLTNGVNIALGAFTNSAASKVLIIVADGEADNNQYPNDKLNEFKNQGGQVYTVGFTFSSSNFANLSSPGCNYTASNADQLKVVMGTITSKIAGLINDPMGKDVALDTDSITITGNTTTTTPSTATDSTLVWTDKGGLKGTVTLTYTVSLRDSAKVAGEHIIPLNDNATFNYYVTGSQTSKSVAFPLPTAKIKVATLDVKYTLGGQNADSIVAPIHKYVILNENGTSTFEGVTIPAVGNKIDGTNYSDYYVNSVTYNQDDDNTDLIPTVFPLKAKAYEVTVDLTTNQPELPKPELHVAKTVKKVGSAEVTDQNKIPKANIGDTITWEIVVTNSGNADGKFNLSDTLTGDRKVTITTAASIDNGYYTVPARSSDGKDGKLTFTASYTVQDNDAGANLTNKVTLLVPDGDDGEKKGGEDTSKPVPVEEKSTEPDMYPVYVYARFMHNGAPVDLTQNKINGKDIDYNEDAKNQEYYITLGKIENAVTAKPENYGYTHNGAKSDAIEALPSIDKHSDYTKHLVEATHVGDNWELFAVRKGAAGYPEIGDTLCWHLDGVVNVYTVTYHTNYDTDVVTNDAYYFNQYTIAGAPTRDGYTFKGWNTATDGSEVTYDANSTTTLTNDLVLYAQWEENQTPAERFRIIYNANGGSGNTDDTIAGENGNATVSINGFTYTDHTFDGWNTSSDGTGDSYEELQRVILESNLTLYAQWKPNEVTPGTGNVNLGNYIYKTFLSRYGYTSPSTYTFTATATIEKKVEEAIANTLPTEDFEQPVVTADEMAPDAEVMEEPAAEDSATDEIFVEAASVQMDSILESLSPLYIDPQFTELTASNETYVTYGSYTGTTDPLTTGATDRPFNFAPITLDDGVYRITVTENPGADSYVTYDPIAYTFILTMQDGKPIVDRTVTITNYYTYIPPYYPPYVPPTVEIEDDDALGLNTTDHFAYIIGYPDGTVQPGGQITRAEVATIFFRLLTDDVREENFTRTNPYSDVAGTAWYNNAVSTLSAMGIITGYPDGTFRPNASITRAEFAAIAARFDNDGDKTAAAFSDIANHWAKDEISVAYNNGWVDGYPDGTFGPQRSITRAETMTLVNRVLNRKPETEDDLLPDMVTWTDNADKKAWYYLAVQEATNSHYYEFKTNSEYEKWTELRENRDWSQLEK